MAVMAHKTMMKQAAQPILSPPAQQALEQYQQHLNHEVDLSAATIRNYLSDVRLFMAWSERRWANGQEESWTFSPERIATPIITAYRDYLKQELERKPATINRYLVSLKRYFRWAMDTDRIRRDPARVVKLVEETPQAPRHLSDEEEAALVAAVEGGGSLRDYTLVVLMLHTGLRVGEVCHLKWGHVVCQQRSGYVKVWGKGNKFRQVPLNATVRKAIQAYEILGSRQPDQYIFCSQRTKTHLTPRGVGFLINKYACQAGITALRTHDLRHRFGYRMAEKVPLHRLAQIMGHDSLDTTLIYIQGTPSDLQQAVEQIAWE
jgi:integrase/recombinase XerC